MSTDGPTRRSRTRRQRGRAFLGSFAIVAAVLAALGLGGAAATVVQGPRVTQVQVDPEAAVAASGSRLTLTLSQSVADIGAAQVTVTPATPFTVDTSGRSVGVRFGLPLWDETEYTVEIEGVQGAGGGSAATIVERFVTPPLEVFLLQRSADGDDTIFRTDLAGQAPVPVFRHPEIEDFRATTAHLAMSVRSDAGAEVIVTDLTGGSERSLELPGDGFVSNLQSADRGELIGYTYSDRVLGEGVGQESVLYTASLDPTAASTSPTEVVVPGAESRVADWRFVPDSSSILFLTFDGQLLLSGASGEDPVALGAALAIDGIARGSSEAVVERIDAVVSIDLTDATEEPLVAPLDDLGVQGPGVTPLPGTDAGTLRRYTPLAEGLTPLGTTVAVVDDAGAVTPVFEAPAEDAVLQVCVSPSGRYAAVLVAPDIVDNPYDEYLMPLPAELETHIVALADGSEVGTVSGFAASWCQVPAQ